MSLNQAAKTAYKKLEKELKVAFREKAKTDSLIVVNGRKVIPTKKWKKMAEEIDNHEILQYLPSSFTFVDPYFKETSNQTIITERKKWIDDYGEFLNRVRDPELGKTICRMCLLHPTFDIGSRGIFNIIIKGIKLEPHSNPCNVTNYFECPNKEMAEDSRIFDYGAYGRIIYKRLQFAYLRSRDDRQKTFEIDYENDTVFRYDHRFGYFREEVIADEVRELRLHRTSEISLMSSEDIKQCLFNEKSLLTLFEQYEDAENSGYLSEQTIENESDEIKLARESKSEIVKLVASTKDKITSEDLELLSNDLLDKEQSLRDKTTRNSQRLLYPEEIQKCERVKKSGFCDGCGKFANIRCVNCDKWHCFRHWEPHAISQHKFHLIDNLSQRKYDFGTDIKENQSKF